MKLRGKEVKNFADPIIVAEIGQNHNGVTEKVDELILTAKEIGCDYAKFQCWDKDSIFIKSFYENKPGDDYLKTKDLEDTLDQLSLDNDKMKRAADFCKNAGIGFVSTPVDKSYVDFLIEQDPDFIKIASFDLNNLPLIKYAASRCKTIVLSVGLGTLQEIEEAIDAVYSAGNEEIILMHCVAAYPPKDEDINLNNIDLLRDYFGLPVGYSDHSKGFAVSLAAIAKGVCMLEKHFTLDNTVASGDHPISANPQEMKIIVSEGKRINSALGSYKRTLSSDDFKYRKILRRSIVSKGKLDKGQVITEENIAFKRPGTGIQINELPYLLGKKAKCEISSDELIQWKDVE